jgi:hypothetical protein
MTREYAVVAYILQLNGIISENETINAQSLPKVRMPNKGRIHDIFSREVRTNWQRIQPLMVAMRV